jgi:hypothetical protein
VLLVVVVVLVVDAVDLYMEGKGGCSPELEQNSRERASAKTETRSVECRLYPHVPEPRDRTSLIPFCAKGGKNNQLFQRD